MEHMRAIIEEVESALHDASAGKRVDVLRRVTDLFVSDAEQYSDEQTALFDSVMGRLVTHIEGRAAVELSQRLAPMANAPLQTLRSLAGHEDIEVSGPILEKSERLTDGDLVAIAKTRGQAHLARIASRTHLREAVTDALVDHGDSGVANTLAQNPGANFSTIGMAKLVLRADGDDRLAESIGRRSDIPAHIYSQLLSQATDVVRGKLLAAAPPSQQDAIKKILAEISAQVVPKTGTMHYYAAAERAMRPFSQDTDVTKRKLVEFANTKRIAEVAVGLSILSGVPAEQVDRLLHAPNAFGLIVLCKSLTMDWGLAYVIIMMCKRSAQTEELREQYNALTVVSAQRVLRFWQGRQKVANDIFQAPPQSAVDRAK